MRFLSIVAWFVIGAAPAIAQDALRIDPVDMKVKPQAFLGKMIEISGKLSSSNSVGGVILMDGNNAGSIRVDFTWGAKEGGAYEKAMRECGIYRRDKICDVSASGTFRAVEGISNFYVLERAAIRFLN